MCNCSGGYKCPVCTKKQSAQTKALAEFQKKSGQTLLSHYRRIVASADYTAETETLKAVAAAYHKAHKTPKRFGFRGRCRGRHVPFVTLKKFAREKLALMEMKQYDQQGRKLKR